jgi:DNA-binding MarR family transcriptional regulator
MDKPNQTKKTFEVSYDSDKPVLIVMSQKRLGKDYLRMYQDAFLEIAQDKELNQTDTRVVLAILGKLGYENEFNLSQDELGNLLQVAQPNISKSLVKLENKGYLQVARTVGRQKIYQFNPYLAFRSRAKNFKALCDQWDKQEKQEMLEATRAS